MSTMTNAGDRAKCPHCGREARVVWVSPDGKTVAIRCMGYHSHGENSLPPKATSRSIPKPKKKYGKGMVFLIARVELMERSAFWFCRSLHVCTLMNSEKEYVLSSMSTPDLLFKAKVVGLILSKDPEKALDLLSQHYKVAKPNLKVGMPKGHSRKPACYVAKKRTIHVSGREALYNPRLILHEFYHHLRNLSNAQRGTEKYAEKFAEDYLQAYVRASRSSPANYK